MAKLNPFVFVNSILKDKKNLITDEHTEKEYVPFLVNRGLSYHRDCIAFANEMNSRHHLDKKMQHDFLLNTVRAKSRPFVKWGKFQTVEIIERIQSYYGFSRTKALTALSLLTEEQISEFLRKTDVGGSSKS